MLLELHEKISYFWQLPGQWLGLPMSTAGGTGLIPGQGTKTASWAARPESYPEKAKLSVGGSQQGDRKSLT